MAACRSAGAQDPDRLDNIMIVHEYRLLDPSDAIRSAAMGLADHGESVSIGFGHRRVRSDNKVQGHILTPLADATGRSSRWKPRTATNGPNRGEGHEGDAA